MHRRSNAAATCTTGCDVLTPPRHRPHLARRTAPGPPDRARVARARPSGRAGRAPGRRAVPSGERGRRSGAACAALRGRSRLGLAPLSDHRVCTGPRSSMPTTRTGSRWRRWRCRSGRARPGAAGGVAPGGLPVAASFVLALEGPAGGALHRRVGGDSRRAGRRRHPGLAHHGRARRHRRRAGGQGAGRGHPPDLLVPQRRTGGRERRRAGRPQGPEVPGRGDGPGPPSGARCAARDLRRGRSAGAAGSR